ncbi:MAG: hypothetical protein U9Q21_01870 [Candidatus Auribacterota bacterium]|nr:hypothetical protein [Candidatus Auribacterota bacterium]
MEISLITLLLSSLGLLSIMALFRWKAYDEMYNALKIRAEEWAMIYALDTPKKEISTHKIASPLDNLIELLNSSIIIIEQKQANDKEPLMNLLWEGRKGALIKERQTLIDLGSTASEIKKFFNRPFYFMCLVLITYLAIEISNLPITHMNLYSFFSSLMISMSFLGIAFASLRFYNLFNFSYEKNATHGFDRIPFIYDLLFKPRF